MQTLKILSSDVSLYKNIPKRYQLRAESCYTRCDGGKKTNAYGGIKELYVKLQPVILFQGENQLDTELQEF